MELPQRVKLVEVSPRDGLQNEQQMVDTATKVKFIELLAQTGLSTIEVSSFVSEKKIPQLKDAEEVLAQLDLNGSIRYPVLVPNAMGMEHALTANAKEVAVFLSATETFSQKNINCSIAESFDRVEEIMALATPKHIPVRGYISCTMGCPYEGEVKPKQVLDVAKRLYDMGCYEISIGDTIGVGTAKQAQQLMQQLFDVVPVDKLAAHFHDTYGQALANLLAVMQLGISTIDCSTAGLGGCPYAKGASGNVATEDVLYCLNGLGIETGVDLDKILVAGKFICKALKHPPRSKVALARN